MSDESQQIEQDFQDSWDKMDEFFHRLVETYHWEGHRPIFNILAEMRQRGYDKQLRAGQSMSTFVLTRARNHHYRAHHGRIRLDVKSTGLQVNYYKKDEEKIEIVTDSFDYTDEIDALIQRLLQEPIT